MIDKTSTQSGTGTGEDGSAGIIYVLTNPAMPDLVKIGRTLQSDVSSRISQLYTTGVPLPFECVRAVTVDDASQAEKALQKAFEPNRLNKNREFFEINVEQVIALLDLIKIEDVTPGIQQDADDNVDSADVGARERLKKRRPRTRFDEFGIPEGAVLKFIRDGSTATVVNSGTTVDYDGEELAISRLTGYLLGGSTEYVSPLNHWTYEGTRLKEISDKVHGWDG